MEVIMRWLERLSFCVILFISKVNNAPLDYKHNNDSPTLLKSDFPEEDLFEGDIILQSDQLRIDVDRNLVSDPSALWPGKVLYYRFEPGEFDYIQRWRIQEALKDMMTETCVRFVERTSETTFVNLRNTGQGCAGAVGYHHYGGLDLFLGGLGCQTRGTIQHEFMHSLGFWHEHTRHDRDKYIKVLWKNISPGREVNFLKRSASEVLPIRMPYDYGSVMHYRSNSFSKDHHSPTIIPFAKGVAHKLGQRIRFSQVDIAKLNRLYNCPPLFYRGEDIINNSSLYGDVKNLPELIQLEPEKENVTSPLMMGAQGIQNITKPETIIFKIPVPESVLNLFEIGKKPNSTENSSKCPEKNVFYLPIVNST